MGNCEGDLQLYHHHNSLHIIAKLCLPMMSAAHIIPTPVEKSRLQHFGRG